MNKKQLIFQLKFYATEVLILSLLGTGAYSVMNKLDKPTLPEDNAMIILDDSKKDDQVFKVFNPGEHIVAEKPKNKISYNEINQLEYHEGYKVEGLNIDAPNKYVLYSNVDSVEAYSTGFDEDNNPVYTDFGTLIEPKAIVEKEDGVFKPGEHILAVPISSPSLDELQFNHYDGYEAIDICTKTGGYPTYSYYGGFVVYVNTTNVKCDGDTCKFGTPIEKNKEKTLF